MVYLPSGSQIEEFSAVPSLARFCMASGDDGLEPTLVIKASSLRLKYLMHSRILDLRIVDIGQNSVAYAVVIPDDVEHPAYVWSVVENDDEALALRRLVDRPRCVVHLMNEFVTAVASTEVELHLEPARLFVDSLRLFRYGDDRCFDLALPLLDRAVGHDLEPERYAAIHAGVSEWQEIRASYYTNSLATAAVSLIDADEGAQQEMLAQALADALSPSGAIRGPHVGEGAKARELCDVLITSAEVDVLIESKAFAVLRGAEMPSREELRRRTSKHLVKAMSQLAGARRSIVQGLEVVDPHGSPVLLSGDLSPHLIVLVPDLDLVIGSDLINSEHLIDYCRKTESLLHVLDTIELFRVVQAAAMLANTSSEATRMQALNFYLLERFKMALDRGTAAIRVRLEIAER